MVLLWLLQPGFPWTPSSASPPGLDSSQEAFPPCGFTSTPRNGSNSLLQLCSSKQGTAVTTCPVSAAQHRSRSPLTVLVVFSEWGKEAPCSAQPLWGPCSLDWSCALRTPSQPATWLRGASEGGKVLRAVPTALLTGHGWGLAIHTARKAGRGSLAVLRERTALAPVSISAHQLRLLSQAQS